MLRTTRSCTLAVFGLAALGAMVPVTTMEAHAGEAPEIRSSPSSKVPACVTPDRLMTLVIARNPALAPKFAKIATHYRDLGDAWRVRWDYAFYQMILETNYLMYRRGDGSSGDVGLAQNNFAGIGATGGGVPGDRYGDVRTGVMAHIQHLVAYSGERVAEPVATRTREQQGNIIEVSRKLGRPVTFADLARRWAVDRAYARNIETVAEMYRKVHCTGAVAALSQAPQSPMQRPPAAAQRAMTQPSKLGGSPGADRRDSARPQTDGAPKQPALVTTVWRRGEPVAPRPTLAPRPQRSSADVAQTDPGGAALKPSASSGPVLAGAREPEPAASSAADTQRFTFAAPAAVAAGHLQAAAPCRIETVGAARGRAVLVKWHEDTSTLLAIVPIQADTSVASAAGFLKSNPGSELLAEYPTHEEALVAAGRACANR